MVKVRKIKADEIYAMGGRFMLTTDNSTDISTFMVSPTGNCQFCSIAHMENFLQRGDAIECLKAVKIHAKKPMALVDIHNRVCEKLEKVFPKASIVMKQSYKSTNGSDMTIYLLKLEWLQ